MSCSVATSLCTSPLQGYGFAGKIFIRSTAFHLVCIQCVKRNVQEMKAGIDVHALEEDVEAALRLQDLTQQLCHQEASLTR